MAERPNDATEEQARLPEVVPIDELSPGAIAAAAAEIADEQVEEDSTWPTATA